MLDGPIRDGKFENVQKRTLMEQSPCCDAQQSLKTQL